MAEFPADIFTDHNPQNPKLLPIQNFIYTHTYILGWSLIIEEEKKILKMCDAGPSYFFYYYVKVICVKFCHDISPPSSTARGLKNDKVG